MRLNIETQCVVPLDQLIRNAATCYGLERIEKRERHDGRLAIAGGGLSLVDALHDLASFDEVWAINSTAAWLLERGIDCTMITVDPNPPEEFNLCGVEKALLATLCDPRLRAALPGAQLFDMLETCPGGVPGGTTTAQRAVALALRQGFFDVTFFGCEGSFAVGADHVDRTDAPQEMIVVRADGRDHVTVLEFLLQSQKLAEVIRMAPQVFKERSGGLLRAMCADDDWDIVAVSGPMKEHLERVNGRHGFYEAPYSVGG